MPFATGSFNFNYTSNDPTWHLDQGSGSRVVKYEIPLPPLGGVPTVMVALTGLDVGNQANTRVYVNAEDVEAGEFTIVISTWADTVLYAVWGTWFAIR